MRGVPRNSLVWFNRAAKLARPSGEDLRVVALDYILLNDTADALHWQARSTALDPGNAEAWYDPKNPRLHFQLGQLYRRAGDSANAAQQLALSGKLYEHHSSEPDR